jgi:hypothetical protein
VEDRWGVEALERTAQYSLPLTMLRLFLTLFHQILPGHILTVGSVFERLICCDVSSETYARRVALVSCSL